MTRPPEPDRIPPAAPSLRSAIRPMGLTFLAEIVETGSVAVTTVILASALGTEAFGDYVVAMVLVQVIAIFMSLGLPNADIYVINRGRYAKRTILLVNAAFFVVLSVPVLLMLGFAKQMHDLFFPQNSMAVLWYAIGTFPIVLAHKIVTSLVQGLQLFREFNLCRFVGVAVFTPGIVLAAMNGLSLHEALLVSMASFLLPLAYALAVVAKAPFPGSGTERSLVACGRDLLAFGLRLHAGNLVTYLNYRFDVLIVNYLAGQQASGLYGIATRLAEQLWIVPRVVTTVLLPRLTRGYAANFAQANVTPLACRLVLVVVVLLCGLVAAIARPLISILLGAEYLPAVGILMLLLPGVAAYVVVRIIWDDFAARGLVSLNIRIAATCFGLLVGGLLLLVPVLDARGAALACSIAYILTAAWTLHRHRRLCGAHWRDYLLPNIADYRRLRGLVADVWRLSQNRA